MREAPHWLKDFQEQFSSVLRTPMSPAGGVLRAQPSAAGESLGVRPRAQRSAAAGLSDYQRQYWFRLLSVLQSEFPLSSRLMGLWSFNILALKYLEVEAPRSYDIVAIRCRFIDYLSKQNLEPFVLQAAILDEVRYLTFMAPAYEPWKPPTGASSLAAQLRLSPAPDWRIFREDWAIVELCLRLDSLKAEEGLPRPAHLAATRVCLIQKVQQQLVYRYIDPYQGRFYELLSVQTIDEAVAVLAGECAHLPMEELARLIQGWMAQSVHWGLWAN